MEMESRRRELERKKRKRKRELRRRLAVCCAVGCTMCLGVGFWLHTRSEETIGSKEIPEGEHGIVLADPADGLAASNFSGLNVDSRAQEKQSGTNQTDIGEICARETTVALASEIDLPTRFDLREQGTAPTVPDQGTFGTCWAFASLGALESSAPEALRMTFSADHMSIQNSFGLGQDAGGDYSISSSYLLAWQGPVAEAEDPYGDGYSPDALEPVLHVQEIQIIEEKNYEAIKRAVYENGGVQSSFYMPQTVGPERERYYNEETDAFYYDGSLEANHDVVIVGWEDNYPKENFVKEPEEDGAFLCMNTWGESFGDRGFFYVSYEDSRIGSTNVSYTGIEPSDNYDVICQTDLCGWTGQLGYGEPKAWFANVYEAEEAGFLAAAGFYAIAPETSYKVYVADHSLENRTPIAEGYLEHAGFYTVPFAEQVELERGERFAVVIEIESRGVTEPVAVEYAAGVRTRHVDINDGEGYISPDGIQWQRAETELNCNVCLKAYIRK